MSFDDDLVTTVIAAVGRGLTQDSLDGPCRAAAAALRADGVAVTLSAQLGNRAVIGASNAVARLLEQVQLTAGEGPCTEATRNNGPVVTPDVTDPAETRWPSVTRSLLGTPVRAVVAVPLAVGSTPVGSLNVHSAQLHGLDHLEVDAVQAVARLMTVAVLAMRAHDPGGRGSGTDLPAEVPQATGMVSGALGIPPVDAMDRLRGLAFLQDRLLTDVARDVIDGRQPADLGEPDGSRRS